MPTRILVEQKSVGSWGIDPTAPYGSGLIVPGTPLEVTGHWLPPKVLPRAICNLFKLEILIPLFFLGPRWDHRPVYYDQIYLPLPQSSFQLISNCAMKLFCTYGGTELYLLSAFNSTTRFDQKTFTLCNAENRLSSCAQFWGGLSEFTRNFITFLMLSALSGAEGSTGKSDLLSSVQVLIIGTICQQCV
jgi:hypothetical protein